jgi:hypothetical protein
VWIQEEHRKWCFFILETIQNITKRLMAQELITKKKKKLTDEQ